MLLCSAVLLFCLLGLDVPVTIRCSQTVQFVLSGHCVFSGKAETNGKMHVTLCDLIMPWESMSATQKKSLSQRYEMGCDCKVRILDTLEGHIIIFTVKYTVNKR